MSRDGGPLTPALRARWPAARRDSAAATAGGECRVRVCESHAQSVARGRFLGLGGSFGERRTIQRGTDETGHCSRPPTKSTTLSDWVSATAIASTTRCRGGAHPRRASHASTPRGIGRCHCSMSIALRFIVRFRQSARRGATARCSRAVLQPATQRVATVSCWRCRLRAEDSGFSCARVTGCLRSCGPRRPVPTPAVHAWERHHRCVSRTALQARVRVHLLLGVAPAAYAGSTPGTSKTPGTPRDHPRVRGEHTF